MKLSEARTIVGKMVSWLMVNQGIISPGDEQWPDPITEDLLTLLKANRLVERANERDDIRCKAQIEKTGKAIGHRTMTVADRGIAALYVAANFKPDNPALGPVDTLAYHNGGAVICITHNIKDDEDE